MPASLPTTPGGSLIEKWVISCSASERNSLTLKGEKCPAALLVEPAIRPGLKGGKPPEGQAPPSAPRSIVVVAVRWTISSGAGLFGSWADQGVNFAVVVKVPQAGGVTRGARPPSRKCSLKDENGTWGTSSKVETICPVRGSGSTLPACLTRMPRSGIF